MLRILLIEDNEQNRYLMEYLLRKNGFDVVSAGSGRQGIDLAQSLRPDAVLLDIQLPEMTGYQVVEELRRHKELDRVPIVAVTSYAMPGDREKALSSGADGYIEKPIDPETFIFQLQEIFSSFREKGMKDEDNSCR